MCARPSLLNYCSQWEHLTEITDLYYCTASDLPFFFLEATENHLYLIQYWYVSDFLLVTIIMELDLDPSSVGS